MPKKQICPTCRKPLSLDQPEPLPQFPFCSERCQLIDLGHWFDGDYTIPSETPPPPTQNHQDQDRT
ncbi:MAG: DNA gyrase inhibitor YacG [Planctomycetes bacterium]|nr:DNA gyrase inhibitor YacG [Planctomycetota bacterium]